MLNFLSVLYNLGTHVAQLEQVVVTVRALAADVAAVKAAQRAAAAPARPATQPDRTPHYTGPGLEA